MSLLVAEGISKSFAIGGRKVPAVRKCTLAFPPKGLFAIVGKSGSGKSTLLHLLSGMARPSGGDVYFQGERLRNRSHPLLGYEGSFVFQHYDLIEGESAQFNVSLPLLTRGRKRTGVKPLLRRFGLYSLRSRDVSKLSGGEKQRVALCRALSNDPLVLFADEPTGALDEANGRRVMDALKEASRRCLVIFVSHNEQLVQSYADEVIRVSDGQVEVPESLTHVSAEKAQRRAIKHGHGFLPRFLLRNMKKNFVKDAMCFAAGILGFTALLLSFGFFAGNAAAMEEEQSRTLGYLQATVSRVEEVQIPGSKLTLVKQTRPSEGDLSSLLESFESVEALDNYAYFFPPSMPFAVDGQAYDATNFSPVYDLSLAEFGSSLLVRGEAPLWDDFSSCIVNEEFLARYGNGLFGQTVEVSSRSVVRQGQKSYEVYANASFRIAAVVSEFGFMNVPRVYYSYRGLADYLRALTVGEEGAESSITELVSIAAKDEAITSYCSTIFVHDPAEMSRFFGLIERCKEQGFEIDSGPYLLRESFLALSEAFNQSLTLFVGVAMLGLCLILGMATLSSVVAGRKEAAILYVLGARRKDIHAIYVWEALALCVGAALVSLGVSPLFQQIANEFLLKEFDIHHLISIPYASYLGIPFLVVLAVLTLATILGLVSSLVPLSIHKHIPVLEELRDE